jgi:hypothetical protein
MNLEDRCDPTLVYLHGGGWVAGSKEASSLTLLPFLGVGRNVVNVEYRLTKILSNESIATAPPWASILARIPPTCSASILADLERRKVTTAALSGTGRGIATAARRS